MWNLIKITFKMFTNDKNYDKLANIKSFKNLCIYNTQ